MVNNPSKALQKAGFRAGDELEAEASKGRLSWGRNKIVEFNSF